MANKILTTNIDSVCEEVFSGSDEEIMNYVGVCLMYLRLPVPDTDDIEDFLAQANREMDKDLLSDGIEDYWQLI